MSFSQIFGRVLTLEELNTIATRINEMASVDGDPCLVCGSSTELLNTVNPLNIGYNSDISQNRYVPCVATVCDNCGHVRQFVLEKLGIDLIGEQERSGHA